MLAKGVCCSAHIVLAVCYTLGCSRAPSKVAPWETSQQRSDGVATERPSESYDSDVSKEPPAWHPEGAPAPTTPQPETNWKVGDKSRSSSSEPAKPNPSKIDLEGLKTGEVLPGGEFNKFFPRQEGDWDLVYKQEKKGFALASLQRGGEERAFLSVTDLRSNPEAAEKYLQPSGEIQGYPSAEIGSNGLGVLVGGRFQVQVRSASPDFTAGDRAEWIRRFDLQGLEKLK